MTNSERKRERTEDAGRVEALAPKRYENGEIQLYQQYFTYPLTNIVKPSTYNSTSVINCNITARSSHILNSGESDSSKSSSGGSSGYHSVGDSDAHRGQRRFDLPAIRKAASVDCLLVKSDPFRSSRDLREFRYDSHRISMCLSQIWNLLEKLI